MRRLHAKLTVRMRAFLRIGVAIITFGLLGAVTRPARADAKADALVSEGIALSEQGKYTEACPKYAEALKIDPALNTQINLAECYEKIGKPSSAYTLWVTIEQIAKTANRPKDQAKAHDRVTALADSLPRLKITLPADLKGATVKVDGKPIANNDLASVAIDPGLHTIDVTANGKKPWHDEVSVQVGTMPIEVPELATPGSEPPPPEHVASMRPSMGFRIAGGIIAGIGLIGVGVGVVTGTNAIRSRDNAQASCGDPNPNQCHSQDGVQLWRDAKDAGNISTIGFIAGGSLVAIGAVVFLIAPNRPVVSASLDPNGGGRLGLRGTF